MENLALISQMGQEEKSEIKNSLQNLCNKIDSLISEAEKKLPDGSAIHVMRKGELHEWKGASGKYLDIGAIVQK